MTVKRKVIQIKDSTQLVSLPRDWCKAHNLRKGDEVDVDVQKDALIITGDYTPVPSRTAVDITDLKEGMIYNLLWELYRAGFDEILVTFSKKQTTDKKGNPIVFETLLEDAVTKVVAMEITQKTQGSMLLKDISGSNAESINEIINRMMWSLLDYMHEFQKMVTEKDANYTGSVFIQYERMLNRQTNYCLRILNRNRYKDPLKITFLATLVRNIEMIGDKIADIALAIGDRSMDAKEFQGIHKELREMMNLLSQAFREFSKDKAIAIYDKKVQIKYHSDLKNKRSYKDTCDLVDLIEESVYLIWTLDNLGVDARAL